VVSFDAGLLGIGIVVGVLVVLGVGVLGIVV